MAGYWLVRGGSINDNEALASYGALWAPIAEKYGAKILAGKGKINCIEGDDFPRVLIVEFESYDIAVECYQSEEYKNAMVYAHKAYDRELIIVEG